MGSVAYGVSNDTSDCDIYGFAIPPKSLVFPHLSGEIEGFGTHVTRFPQYQQHHVRDKDSGKSYDFSIYNIVKFFSLCADNNPNMVDALFVPSNCVIHITQLGQMVRENRHIFLHRGCWHKFKGYAYQQLHKVENKTHEGLDVLVAFEEEKGIPSSVKYYEVVGEAKFRGIPIPEGKLASPMEDSPAQQCYLLANLKDTEVENYLFRYNYMMRRSTRAERVKIDGTDRKFLYHVIRLLDEVEQILTTGDLDLQRAKEQMKAVRRGEMAEEDIKRYFTEKEIQLEKVYQESKLPYTYDEKKLKTLLLQCLEHHYGNLSNCVANIDSATAALREIQAVLDKNRQLL